MIKRGHMPKLKAHYKRNNNTTALQSRDLLSQSSSRKQLPTNRVHFSLAFQQSDNFFRVG